MTEARDAGDLPFISHGTMAGEELAAMRAFYRGFLGMETVRHLPIGVLVRKGGDWVIAAGAIGSRSQPQDRTKRWELSQPSPDEVLRAHAYASEKRDEFGLRAVEDPVHEEDGSVSFVLQDLDGNWWEPAWRPLGWADWHFAQGDIGEGR